MDDTKVPNEKLHEPAIEPGEKKEPYKPPFFTFRRIEVPSKETAKVKAPSDKN
ncbi:MAG: hypothetical protein QOH96_4185 [Blastocatellia bacterium]|nr:hypothetical protein [Blastocatellia bacterium]